MFRHKSHKKRIIDELLETNSTMVSSLTECNRINSELNEMVGQVRRTNANLENKIQQLEDQLARNEQSYEHERQTRTADYDRLEAARHHYKSRSKSKERQLTDLENRCLRLKDSLQRKEDELSKMKDSHSERQEEISKLKKEKLKIIRYFCNKLRSIEKQPVIPPDYPPSIYGCSSRCENTDPCSPVMWNNAGHLSEESKTRILKLELQLYRRDKLIEALEEIIRNYEPEFGVCSEETLSVYLDDDTGLDMLVSRYLTEVNPSWEQEDMTFLTTY